MEISYSFTENELLVQLRSGNSLAFEKLYNAYKHRLAIRILRIVKDEELTEDLLQELFIKVWHNREEIDPERSFNAYLYRIASNLVMDSFRKLARDQKLETQIRATTSEVYSYIEEKIFEKEELALLQLNIDKLPPQRKLVFTMCKIEGKSYKEVSELMGISVNTVNDHVKKANSFLKSQLNPSVILLYLILSSLS